MNETEDAITSHTSQLKIFDALWSVLIMANQNS